MAESIDVIWLSFHQPDILERGYWDQGILEDTFNKGNFVHHQSIDNVPPEVEGGAVVVINGRTHIEDTDKINEAIANLTWCLFIITGDEEALFPWREIHHPIMRVWVQLPRMNEHNDTSYKLVNGYRPTTREQIKRAGLQERTIDYAFMGQNNHERRQQCVDVLRQFQTVYPTAIVEETDGFGKEVTPYPDYIDILAKTKIVACPSGVETPDSFRLYEALEAGCIPVVDAFSTNNKAPGFWSYLFGGEVPFPVVDYWDKFPILLPELLKDYPANANRVFAWWQLFKRNLYWKLIDDIRILHG